NNTRGILNIATTFETFLILSAKKVDTPIPKVCIKNPKEIIKDISSLDNDFQFKNTCKIVPEVNRVIILYNPK
ncbi:MAG: hypothetical protein IJE44_02930, partial [Clostridia bacterium]|nr:hypothetical protein [Clostridia bacterium]